MKWIATSFLLAFLIAIAIIIAIFAIALPTGKTEIRIVQEEIYTLQNALSAAKNYITTAAAYSLYQACYDVLRSEEIITDEQQFITELEKEVSKNMAVYTSKEYSFLGGYMVSLPQYNVKIHSERGRIIINLTGDNLVITKKYIGQPISTDVKIEKVGNASINVSTNCYDVFILAMERLNNEKHSIQKKFDDLKEVANTQLVLFIKDVFNEGDVTCKRAFELTVGKSFEDVASAIEEYLSGQIVDPYIKVKKIEARVEPLLVGRSSYVGKDGIARTDIECRYSYIAELNLTVNMPTGDQKYPVWNGTDIAFESLTAQFTSKLDLRKSLEMS